MRRNGSTLARKYPLNDRRKRLIPPAESSRPCSHETLIPAADAIMLADVYILAEKYRFKDLRQLLITALGKCPW